MAGGAGMAGGRAWQGACMVGGMHGRRHVWQGECAWQGGIRGGGACMADTTRYGDTVNERAVRIVLECILVKFCLDLYLLTFLNLLQY